MSFGLEIIALVFASISHSLAMVSIMPIEPVQRVSRAISIQDEGARPEEAHEEKALIASDDDDGDAVEKTAVTPGDAGEK